MTAHAKQYLASFSAIGPYKTSPIRKQGPVSATNSDKSNHSLINSFKIHLHKFTSNLIKSKQVSWILNSNCGSLFFDVWINESFYNAWSYWTLFGKIPFCCPLRSSKHSHHVNYFVKCHKWDEKVSNHENVPPRTPFLCLKMFKNKSSDLVVNRKTFMYYWKCVIFLTLINLSKISQRKSSNAN